jgi:hypothetical protein
MNFAEFHEVVPEGFHDAEVLRIEQDFAGRTIRLLVNFWWRGPDDPPDKPDQKLGWITLTGIERWVWTFYSVYKNSWGDSLQIDGGEAGAKILGHHAAIYEGLEDRYLKGWFYIRDWNAIVCWAAADIAVEFVSE